MVQKFRKGIASAVLKKTSKLPHATVKEAVQKRDRSSGHSSIIPGISINELKHSLDLLKYALDYSEAIVDTVREPLIVLNKNLRVLTANRSFYRTFKLTPAQTENQHIYKIGDNWDIPQLQELLEKILPNNIHFENFELEHDFPNIGKRTLLLSARRTYRQVNEIEAILLAFEDITDRKDLERQKDDFIGIVSHELKTPLTSIKVFAQILQKYLEHKKDKKSIFLLSKITKQMNTLTQLMVSFVKVYQIQNGKLTLHKKQFSLDDLIKEIVLDFQYTSSSHLVSCKCNAKKDAFADRDRIAQVLVNLISNAIKYSPGAKEVLITTSDTHNSITVSVQDFGLGIPKEEQGKIFDRFFRVKGKRKGHIRGLGLGLYISSEIVKQHKGRIWVESKEGKGSKFYFTVPVKK